MSERPPPDVYSHLDRYVALVPVLVWWCGGGCALVRQGRGGAQSGGCGGRSGGDLREPHLQHHLHLQQNVQVFPPGDGRTDSQQRVTSPSGKRLVVRVSAELSQSLS